MRSWKVGTPAAIAVVCMGLAGLSSAEDQKDKATLDNMQAAYNGASNARTRYEAFASVGAFAVNDAAKGGMESITRMRSVVAATRRPLASAN